MIFQIHSGCECESAAFELAVEPSLHIYVLLPEKLELGYPLWEASAVDKEGK
jgi:hypothetical protein